MVIRHAVSHAAAGLFALTLGVAAGSSGAFAQANVLKECGSQYQDAKSKNELAGQTWQDYLKGCKERIKAAAPAEAAPAAKPVEAAKPAEPAKPAETAPAPAAETPAPNPLKPPATTAEPVETPAPAAPKMTTRERQKQCAAEWKAQKVELKKTDPKITWPKYWSACNKRLKGE